MRRQTCFDRTHEHKTRQRPPLLPMLRQQHGSCCVSLRVEPTKAGIDGARASWQRRPLAASQKKPRCIRSCGPREREEKADWAVESTETRMKAVEALGMSAVVAPMAVVCAHLWRCRAPKRA